MDLRWGPQARRRLRWVIVIFLCIAATHLWSEQVDATSSATRTSGADATTSASRAAGAPRDIATTLYNVGQRPALRLCLLVAALGILYRIWQFRRLTRLVRGRLSAGARAAKTAPMPGYRSRGRGVIPHPVMRTVSLTFHFLLFLVPLLLPAHNMILHRSLHASLPSIPAPLADWLTMVLIALGVFFLARRLLFPRVRVLSTVSDYLILLLVLTPFVTGLMAYHHVSSSPWLMIVHIASADALFLLLPFTKLGHMPFLIFSRFFVSGEYAWRPGRRAWGKGV
ncbi:MAG: hypothetical protein ACLQCB_14545 [Spirochaetia bacterium]